MSDKRVIVWVQKFNDRPNLMLQWIDPFTGAHKSKSAETSIPAVAEMKRTELEYELNHGLHKEASRMSWERRKVSCGLLRGPCASSDPSAAPFLPPAAGRRTARPPVPRASSPARRGSGPPAPWSG